jgi:hypothetical protein
VGGGERKEGGEKIIHLLPNNEDVDNTCQSERNVALNASPETTIGYF